MPLLAGAIFIINTILGKHVILHLHHLSSGLPRCRPAKKSLQDRLAQVQPETESSRHATCHSRKLPRETSCHQSPGMMICDGSSNILFVTGFDLTEIIGPFKGTVHLRVRFSGHTNICARKIWYFIYEWCYFEARQRPIAPEDWSNCTLAACMTWGPNY